MTVDDHTLGRVVEFHGHLCPGLTMGMQAARIALREIGPHSKDEEVVAVVETDMCAVDAVQVMTGCTFGKGNLIHRDWGKNAYTFFRRSDGKAVRIAGRADAWRRDPELQELFASVRAGEAGAEGQTRVHELREASALRLLDEEPDALFTIEAVDQPPPAHARVHDSVTCAACGEATMETRIRRLGGRELCPPCFDGALAAR